MAFRTFLSFFLSFRDNECPRDYDDGSATSPSRRTTNPSIYRETDYAAVIVNERRVITQGDPHVLPKIWSVKADSLSLSTRVLPFSLPDRSFTFSLSGCDSRGDASGIGKKPDLQKSSPTGFLSFYRVSLSPDVFCQAFCAISQLLHSAIRDHALASANKPISRARMLISMSISGRHATENCFST